MKRVVEKFLWEGEKIKGSRFIVNIAPICSDQEAKAFLDEIASCYSDARHHCFAYCLADGTTRSSDSGEPRGSAGLPILQRVESSNLVDTIVIVTRYFGGVKLGVGGLIRAYGGAAGDALKKVETKDIILGSLFLLRLQYSDLPILNSVVHSCKGEIREEEYWEDVSLTIFIPKGQEEQFQNLAIEKTSNRVSIEKKK